jgi:hypothetical protein
MRRYTFLIKPAFFIMSLLGCTWMTLKIETISPSVFGEDKSTLLSKAKPIASPVSTKEYFKNLCFEYKTGLIDSTTLDTELDHFIQAFEQYQTQNIMDSGSDERKNKAIIKSKRD